MTQRKPSGMSPASWVERQIREATAAGAFQDLPGAGRPIPGIDHPRPELAWVASYLHREDIDSAALLPPALALAKEVESLPQRLVRLRDEQRVRAVVTSLNGRIARAQAGPQIGPPVRVTPLDVDATIADWRRARDALRLAAQVAREQREAAARARGAAERAAGGRGAARLWRRLWRRLRVPRQPAAD